MPHLRDISSQVGAAAEPRDAPGFTSFVCLLTFSPKARGLARGRDPGRGQGTGFLLRAPRAPASVRGWELPQSCFWEVTVGQEFNLVALRRLEQNRRWLCLRKQKYACGFKRAVRPDGLDRLTYSGGVCRFPRSAGKIE